MAHFVSLEKYVPSPDDDISVISASNGSALIGLWGFMDAGTACTVQVISGPGKAVAKEKRGSAVQVWALSGLSASSKVQAFSGTRPFTGVYDVKMSVATNTLGDQNKALLNGHDPEQRAFIGGAPVAVVPLAKAIGDYAHSPKMGTVRGLAVHITAGTGAAGGFKGTFESRGASTHFVIDRGGSLVQYVAASIKAQAQGPGNSHFLSVELVGQGNGQGACQLMTEPQLRSLRELWGWLRGRYPSVPPQLALPYAGTGKFMSNKLTPLYRDMAVALATSGACRGTGQSIPTCIDSWGLSCHYWLDTAVKACPGIGIMGQLPQVLGRPRVRVGGDDAFMLN
jgi:hypothetical protein